MKSRNVADFCKNALGTVFLLAGAFFVCSTLLSIRAVFADPIMEQVVVTQNVTSPRASADARGNTVRNSNPRANSRVSTPSGRAVTARTATNQNGVISSRANANNAAAARANATNPRGTATRVVSARATPAATDTRNVVARAAVNTNARGTTSRGVATRTVRSRSAVVADSAARTSLTGSAIRGAKTTGTTYTYLQNKLYTGNYSNIIDSSTGLISAEAYNNCMESYYTCMDEICTARNAAQRRCACAGRVKAFAEAETALEQANEELIKVSGELALLVANKGKDVSDAFQLTDAEKVMNCVSWQEVTSRYGMSSTQAIEWCNNHGVYYNDSGSSKITSCNKPSYCSTGGNDFGFDITNIDGNSSDILASLQSWANAKAQTLTILTNNDDAVQAAFDQLSGAISGMAGLGGALAASDSLKDSLAETWGYELFEYAHNNVCNRVLDSCFNGIYEACGTPPSGGRKCSNGAASCPYNYNSVISVNNSGSYELNFVSASNSYTATNSAACFGYTSSSGDPYSSLRGPVADARRSILQKYALDANADCDAYGEQLRVTAQNIGYQKVAAQQALQQKRLEFANEERETVLADALAASTNFNECMSDLLDCYENQATYNPSWSTSRIKTYCAQVANVPTCYDTMICNPSSAPFKAVIDKSDSASCKYTDDYTTNTCRNIVTLNDILNGTGATLTADELQNGISGCSLTGTGAQGATCNSMKLREYCLQKSFVDEVRGWKKINGTCNAGYRWDSEAERCVIDTSAAK